MFNRDHWIVDMKIEKLKTLHSKKHRIPEEADADSGGEADDNADQGDEVKNIYRWINYGQP